MVSELYPRYCYCCDSRHEVRVRTILGQDVYLCGDCYLDYESKHTEDPVFLSVVMFESRPAPEQPFQKN